MAPLRFSVQLDPEDVAVLLRIQAAEQIRLNKRITSAEVIRIAIREKDANLNSWS